MSEKRYRVRVCATCRHPGGQHRMVNGWGRPAPCRLCPCDEWIDGEKVWWSHEETHRLETESGAECECGPRRLQPGEAGMSEHVPHRPNCPERVDLMANLEKSLDETRRRLQRVKPE